MEGEARKRIEEIIGGMSCPKALSCAKSGFENLCRAEDVGLEHHLRCLDGTAYQCKFSVILDKRYFCVCPLRVYLAKHAGRGDHGPKGQ
ncbi:MAG: hypothetical protein ABIP48_17480 [Planctomycetota bacterium]